MVLMPESFLEKMQICNNNNSHDKKEILRSIKQPVEQQVYQSFTQMNDILNDNQKSDELKAKEHSDALQTFNVLREKMNSKMTAAATSLPSTTTTTTTTQQQNEKRDEVIESAVESMPKSIQRNARLLLNRLKTSGSLNWSPTGELISSAGALIGGSNVTDLIGGVLRNRKTPLPSNINIFLREMASINMPEEFIKNKKLLNRYRNLKSKHLPAGDILISSDDEEDNYTRNVVLERANKIRKMRKKRAQTSSIRWKTL